MRPDPDVSTARPAVSRVVGMTGIVWDAGWHITGGHVVEGCGANTWRKLSVPVCVAGTRDDNGGNISTICSTPKKLLKHKVGEPDVQKKKRVPSREDNKKQKQSSKRCLGA